MSKFGLRIHSVEAAVIYEYNLGLRDKYEYTDAMFTNSLLSDYLKTIGLNEYKGKSTRDIVCVKFNFGCGSYDDNVKRINKQLLKCETEQRKENLEKARIKVDKNKDKYRKIKVDELRKIFYKDGFSIKYKDRIKTETIRYKFLYRTPGKAKLGEAVFINEKLFDKASNWMRMGIELPDTDAPIVEIGAYQSLSASTIIDKIHIDPSNILIIPDVDSFMTTDVVSVELNEGGECRAVSRAGYQLKNTMFDGQALIDKSIFPEWADGYILLRHHFCKMAAFSSNIQQFFMDYYGADYERAEVKDYWGRAHKVKDIKLITTENAIKWLKFGVDYDYWSDWVRMNGSMFGIVKTAHESKIGNLQRMSYQMVNALSLPIMDDVVKPSLDYIARLKNDDEFFLDYLRRNVNFVNDYEVLLALAKHNPDFLKTDFFKDRRYAIISLYGSTLKNGKLLQEGDNLVIVGSPYAQLLAAVGEDPLLDPTFDVEEDCMQCYTERFEDGEYLAEFRSPFNSYANMGCLHNRKHELLKKYINIGKQCIAVNMNHTYFQDRNNGSDQDSDSIYVTNNPVIADHAKYCMKKFQVVVNNIPKEKNHYNNTAEDKATADHRLMEANTAIGESSNLAQLCLTYTFNKTEQKYLDNSYILAVLAQVAIDNAKRTYAVDLSSEIKRIKNEVNPKENGLPQFWFYIKRKNHFSKADKNAGGRLMKNYNPSLVCPMNYCCDLTIPRVGKYVPTTSFMDMVEPHKLSINKRKCKKVEDLIEEYQISLFRANTDEEEFDYEVWNLRFEELLEDIRGVKLSGNYTGLMYWLIRRAFVYKNGKMGTDSNLWRNRGLLLTVLYKNNPKVFLSMFKGKES